MSRGSNILTNFQSLGLSKAILRAVVSAGYETPTPIQAAAIPVLLEKRDILGIAQTGTGKTAAFVLPLLDQVLNRHTRPLPNTCDMLILAPTRELAAQIHENIRLYGKYTDVTSTIIVGGVKPGKQIKSLARGVNMLVATPGRLEDLQSSGAISLNNTKAVVLDEADQMLDMGFIPAIRRIMKSLPSKRQTVLFSATMPKQIRSLAQDFLHRPQEIAVAPASKPIDRIEQSVIAVAKADKRQKLVDVLKAEDLDRAIVFTRTKHGANKVARHLEQAGLSADAIHGNKSQSQRMRTLGGFKSGDISILVATDIAARGIDIGGVSHVINFDLPNVPEAYVHRIGRTARAGASGKAISFCDTEELDLMRDIEKLIGHTFDGVERPVSHANLGPSPKGERHAPRRSRNTNGRRRSADKQRSNQRFGAPARSSEGGSTAEPQKQSSGAHRKTAQVVNGKPRQRAGSGSNSTTNVKPRPHRHGRGQQASRARKSA